MSVSREVLALALSAAAVAAVLSSLLRHRHPRQAPHGDWIEEVVRGGVLRGIHETELRAVRCLSSSSRVFIKCESGGAFRSSKDRLALSVVVDAVRRRRVRRAGVIVEGSSGSTAISLAFVARGEVAFRRALLVCDCARARAHCRVWPRLRRGTAGRCIAREGGNAALGGRPRRSRQAGRHFPRRPLLQGGAAARGYYQRCRPPRLRRRGLLI